MITTLEDVIKLLAINRTVDLSAEQKAVVRDKWLHAVTGPAKVAYNDYFFMLDISERDRIKEYWGF